MSIGIQALSDCTDCAKLVGDKYWNCIEKYCKTKNIEKFLLLNEKYGKSAISANKIIDIFVNGQTDSFYCYDKCQFDYRNYDCMKDCESFHGQNESFEALKQLLTGVTKINNDKKPDLSVKNNFVSCNKACIQRNCLKVDEKCFDACLSYCPMTRQSLKKMEKKEILTENKQKFNELSHRNELKVIQNKGFYPFITIQTFFIIVTVVTLWIVFMRFLRKKTYSMNTSENNSPYSIII